MSDERIRELWEEVEDLEERFSSYVCSDVEQDKTFAEDVIHPLLTEKQKELWDLLAPWVERGRVIAKTHDPQLAAKELEEIGPFFEKHEEALSYFAMATSEDLHVMEMSGVFDDHDGPQGQKGNVPS